MNLLARALALALFACVATPHAASAQLTNFDFPGSPQAWTNGALSSDDWGRCARHERESADQTLRSCNRIIGERPDGAYIAAAYYFRGRMYEILRDDTHAGAEFANAQRWFTLAAGTDRSDPQPYANRATVLTHLGRYDEALADYNTALATAARASSHAGTRVRSGVADLRVNQIAGYHEGAGGVYFRRQDWSNAISAFDQAAALAPHDAYAQTLRCEARAAAGADLDRASTACEAAIAGSDQAPYAYFSRGFLRFKRGDFDGAAQDFAIAVSKDDTDYVALYAQGVALVHAGHASEGNAMVAHAMEETSPFDINYYAAAGLRV